jgi:hypothetical protein
MHAGAAALDALADLLAAIRTRTTSVTGGPAGRQRLIATINRCLSA